MVLIKLIDLLNWVAEEEAGLETFREIYSSKTNKEALDLSKNSMNK